MRYPKQVSEGLRCLPVDVLGGGLELPLLLLLGGEQVHEGRVRQALKRNRAVEKSVFYIFMGGSF